MSLDTGAETESLVGELVTGNYFQVLGTPPALGRTFLPDEDRRGSPAHVAVVSYRFWQNRLSGTPAAIGREIQLNGAPYVVIGVAPPRFVGATVGRAPDVWLPMALQQEVRPPSAGLRRALGGSDLLGQRGPRWLSMVARIRPDATDGAASCRARPACPPPAGRISADEPARAPSTPCRSAKARGCGRRRGRCCTCSPPRLRWCC